MRSSTKWTINPDLGAVAKRYLAERAPERYTTNSSYSNRLENFILPRWGSVKLADIRPLDLDGWFRLLPVAATTKAGIKTVFRQVLEYSMLLGALPAQRNPLDLIRIKGSTRRRKVPRILTPEECHKLLEKITIEPFRTMVIVALCLGIRRSELTGLKWEDFNWEKGTVMICRSVVENRVDAVKTEASERPLPLDSVLISLLQSWRNTTRFKKESDWVWGSPQQEGLRPYYPSYVHKAYLRPAGISAGLGAVGWHDLRHSYRALLEHAGTPIGIQKNLMRHSNIGTTMNVYGSSLPDEQRSAQSAVTRIVLQ